MRTIQLSDPLFDAAQKLATASGFATVDAFVADLVDRERRVDLTGFFTPDRLAEIDRAVEEVNLNGTLSMDEVDAHFAQKRAEWASKQAR